MRSICSSHAKCSCCTMRDVCGDSQYLPDPKFIPNGQIVKPPVATLEDIARNADVSCQMIKLELSKSHVDIQRVKRLLSDITCNIVAIRAKVEQPEYTEVPPNSANGTEITFYDTRGEAYRGDAGNDPDNTAMTYEAYKEEFRKKHMGTDNAFISINELNIRPGSFDCMPLNCSRCSNRTACQRGI